MYDLIVVGAGPAGIMCSLYAAKNYIKVLLIDSNEEIGKKLSITGGGRCNVCNNKDTKDLIEYIHNGKFLYSALTNFNSYDIIDYFNSNQLPLKEEDNGRMFPSSNKAKDIINILKKDLKEHNVDFMLGATVTDILIDDGVCTGVKVGKKAIEARNVVIATGGSSYKQTGSSGLGYEFARKCGHTIEPLKPALTPLKAKLKDVANLQGLSLQNVTVSNYNKKVSIANTDMIFTHDGISGPGPLKISDIILSESNENQYVIIDTITNMSMDSLIIEIESKLIENKSKSISNALKGLTKKRLLDFIFTKCDIDENMKASNVSNQQIKCIASNLKELRIRIVGHYGINRGFVTKGGINLKEINPKNYESKLVSNIYFIGEVLDIHAHTGGYNITAFMSMGVKCGSNIY